MSPLISIAIPVYNVASCLRRCLDSVMAQTFTDWEAICIDDGSTDGSGDILNEYACKDSRFVAIHQENGGGNCARQRALSMSHGKWIAAVDADDWWDKEFLGSLVEVAKSDDIDMVWGDYYVDRPDRKNASIRISQAGEADANKVLVKILKGEVFGVMWNKLFSRKFIERYQIAYPDGRMIAWEDLWFSISFLSYNPQVRYIPVCHYHYFVRDGSALRSPFTIAKLNAALRVQNFLEALKLPDEADEILKLRRLEIKFNAYSSPYISADTFYGVYKEIKNLSGYPIPAYHKILFCFATRGWLKTVRVILKIIRGARVWK